MTRDKDNKQPAALAKEEAEKRSATVASMIGNSQTSSDSVPLETRASTISMVEAENHPDEEIGPKQPLGRVASGDDEDNPLSVSHAEITKMGEQSRESKEAKKMSAASAGVAKKRDMGGDLTTVAGQPTRQPSSGKAHTARMPQQPQPESITESVRDGRVAMKIVQERIAMMHQEEENDNQQSESAASETELAGQQLQPDQQQQSQPGAVRVAGIDATGNVDDDRNYESFKTDNRGSLSSLPFEPDEPIEAHLVDSMRHIESLPSLPSGINRILVQAEPLEMDQLSSHSDGTELIDVVIKNKKLSFGIAAVIGIMLLGSLAIGLLIGFVFNGRGGDDNGQDSGSDNQGLTTVPVLPALLGKLDETTIETITNDPSSPQARANEWLAWDPNVNTYSPHRLMIRFYLAAVFFTSHGSPDWYRTDNWLNYTAHECSWYSSHPITPCSDDDDMTVLNLTGNGLTGNLLREMVDSFRVIDLSHNEIRGPPPQLNSAYNGLEEIILSDNHFSGEISAEIGYVGKKLRVLRVDNNVMPGTLPAAFIFLAPNLEVLDVSSNRFTGKLPNLFSASVGTHMRVLDMSNNFLTGSVPSSYDVLESLEQLNISGNLNVSGTIPEGLGSLANLTLLDVSDTSISGSIPVNSVL